MPYTFSYCNACKSINKINYQMAQSKRPICGKCSSELNLHRAVTEIDDEGLRKILNKSSLPVVVDFFATWCEPCKMYGPIYEEVSEKFLASVTFVKINTQWNPVMAQSFAVKGIPCTILFKDGHEVKRQAGAMDANSLEAWLKQEIS
jgi:thioredoxin 2